MAADPLLTALKTAVTVPHPWPGTHPDVRGTTVAGASNRRTTGFEPAPNVQYVLASTTRSRSPTWAVIVVPLSVWDRFTVCPPVAGPPPGVVDDAGRLDAGTLEVDGEDEVVGLPDPQAVRRSATETDAGAAIHFTRRDLASI